MGWPWTSRVSRGKSLRRVATSRPESGLVQLRHASYPSVSRDQGQLGAALGHDHAVHQQVDPVGGQLVQHPLVVGDDQHPQLGSGLPHGVDALGHGAESVHVEARVGLVQHGQLGLEDGHLQDLVALLLAPGEAVVQVALAEGRVHAQLLHPLHHHQSDLEHRQVHAPAGREGLAQELDDRDAADGLGLLEGQEDPGLAADVGGPPGDVLAVEPDGSGGHLEGGVAEQHVGQRGLARAVGPHQRVHLSRSHGQVDALQDRLTLHRDMEALDLQEGLVPVRGWWGFAGHGPSLPSFRSFSYGNRGNVDVPWPAAQTPTGLHM